MITMTLGQLLRQKLEMSIDITYQKKVADAYLKSIEMISPRAIIAGGCVSDWHLGRPANDIDIFLTLPTGISTKDMSVMLHTVTCGYDVTDLTWMPDGENQEAGYSINPAVLGVFEVSHKEVGRADQKVQFIVCENTYKALDAFPFGITRCWRKNGESHFTDEFKFSLDNKALIVLTAPGLLRDKHKQKIIGKHPDMQYYDNMDAYKEATAKKLIQFDRAYQTRDGTIVEEVKRGNASERYCVSGKIWHSKSKTFREMMWDAYGNFYGEAAESGFDLVERP